MRIFDARGLLLRPTDDGVWVGDTFYFCPPLAHALGLPGVTFAEPLRVQLAFGESIEDGEREVERLRRRYVASLVLA